VDGGDPVQFTTKPKEAEMQGRARRGAVVVMISQMALAACAAKPDVTPPRPDLGAWLKETPRTVAVMLERPVPGPYYEAHVSSELGAAGKGFAGGVAYAISLGLPGIILMPIIAPARAIEAAIDEPEVRLLEPAAAGVARLYASVTDPIDVGELLVERLVERGNALGALAIRVTAAGRDSGDFGPRTDATLSSNVERLWLVGGWGGDPEAKFLFEGKTRLSHANGEILGEHSWKYESAERRLSDWAASDAKLFRREFDNLPRVVDDVAAKIIANLLPLR
jgi:hypothetical protein